MITSTIRRATVATSALAVAAVLFAGCSPSPRTTSTEVLAARVDTVDAGGDAFDRTGPSPEDLAEHPTTTTTSVQPPEGPASSPPSTTAPTTFTPETSTPEASTDAPSAPAPTVEEPAVREPSIAERRTNVPGPMGAPDDLAAPAAPGADEPVTEATARAAAPPAPPLAEAPALDAAALAASARAQAGERVVLDAGHVDLIEVSVDGRRLAVHVKDDTSGGGAVFRSPTDVQARVKDSARIQVPADPAFAFLGAPGSDLWMLPQVQDPTLLWPGWSTERISAGQVQGDQVTLRLATVDGPGSFALFTTNQFGVPNVIFDNDGSAPNSTVIPIRTHAHSSWAFGAPGVYRVTFEVSATLADGTPVATPVTYVVLVGDATSPLPWDRTGDPATTAPVAPPDRRAAVDGGSATDPATSPTVPGVSGSGGAGATGASGRSGASPAGPGLPAGSLARTGSSPLLLGYLGVGLLVAGAGLMLRQGRRAARPPRG